MGEITMKLFMVEIMDTGLDEATVLIVAESAEEAEQRACKEHNVFRCWVSEVDEVDGYKVLLEAVCDG